MHAIPRSRWFFIITLITLMLPIAAAAQIGITVSFGPPALPIYAQPICPAPNYLWVPGYWAYDPNFGDYFWVPGTWVLAPEPGYLWTPPYWAFENDAYYFHPGYWAPEVGYYGGIDYGYGYFGHGYEGGRWNHGDFYYNRAVNNVNVTNIRNVYEVPVNEPREASRVSYNGGPGGIEARPTPAEEAASRERHIEPVAAQMQHVQEARGNPELRATANHGKPPVAATPKPTTFKGAGVVPAREAGAPYRPPARPGETAVRPENQPNRANTAARPENPPTRETNAPAPRPQYNERTPMHARDVTPHTAPPPPSNANAAQQREEQQREQQIRAEDEQHQRLAQQQAEEHQRMAQQNANARQMQEMEQRHAQQTQQMEQRHAQAQPMRQQQPPPHGESRPAPGAKPSPDRR